MSHNPKKPEGDHMFESFGSFFEGLGDAIGAGAGYVGELAQDLQPLGELYGSITGGGGEVPFDLGGLIPSYTPGIVPGLPYPQGPTQEGPPLGSGSMMATVLVVGGALFLLFMAKR